MQKFGEQQTFSLSAQFQDVATRIEASNLPSELMASYLAIAHANIERLKSNPDVMTITMATESMLLMEGMLERDRAASLDALTGARNRRAFDSDLDDAIELTNRDKEHRVYHALLFLDADYFKQINDNMGHEGGDQALIKIVKTAEHTARHGEHVYRLGGDEFAILLTDAQSSSPEEAKAHFERARERFDDAFSTMTIEHNGQERPLQVSSGYHMIAGHETAKDVKELGDAALYTSKQTRDDRQAAVWALIRNRQSPAESLTP